MTEHRVSFRNYRWHSYILGDVIVLNGHPFVGKQSTNLTCTLGRQTRENVLQVGVWIMTIQPRRLEQAHDRCRPLASA